MPTCHEYRCPEGCLIQQYGPMRDYPRTIRCETHDQDARVIISRTYFTIDTTDRIDYTPMAGRNFNTRRERDAWLERENRWIPEADDPRVKDAFAYLEHEREFRRSVEAKGERWEEYLKDKKRQEDEAVDANARANGITITPMTGTQAQQKMGEAVARRGQTDARWFQERMRLTTPETAVEALLPELPEEFSSED